MIIVLILLGILGVTFAAKKAQESGSKAATPPPPGTMFAEGQGRGISDTYRLFHFHWWTDLYPTSKDVSAAHIGTGGPIPFSSGMQRGGVASAAASSASTSSSGSTSGSAPGGVGGGAGGGSGRLANVL